jgi:23S rRNA C2498 (ribose-2'-O)-methylase RlmM
VPKVTTHSLCPECIANLKLPIDAFYRESHSGVNIAKRNITTGDGRGYNSKLFMLEI